MHYYSERKNSTKHLPERRTEESLVFLESLCLCVCLGVGLYVEKCILFYCSITVLSIYMHKRACTLLLSLTMSDLRVLCVCFLSSILVFSSIIGPTCECCLSSFFPHLCLSLSLPLMLLHIHLRHQHPNGR